MGCLHVGDGVRIDIMAAFTQDVWNTIRYLKHTTHVTFKVLLSHPASYMYFLISNTVL